MVLLAFQICERKACFESWNEIYWSQTTLVDTSVTYSAHSEHAQWHVQYPNIISLFWIEYLQTNK
jgi:hypothetical protein